jgi:hypothetical protein
MKIKVPENWPIAFLCAFLFAYAVVLIWIAAHLSLAMKLIVGLVLLGLPLLVLSSIGLHTTCKVMFEYDKPMSKLSGREFYTRLVLPKSKESKK